MIQRLTRPGGPAKSVDIAIPPLPNRALPVRQALPISFPAQAHRTMSTAALSLNRAFSSTPARFAAHEIQDRTDIFEGRAERGLRMLMFGKPGSGKHYDISFVSTGDVLRQEIAEKTDIGRRAEDIVKSGGLVPDELMLEIVMAELDRLQGKSWIIDGFPRTLHQGSLLDKVLNEERRPFNMIVHIDVPDQVIMSRIAARWVHLPSGRVYNTTFSAPKVPGKDDITGEPLVQRPDDTPAVFSKRLEAYYGSTEPLLNYFSTTYPKALKTLKGTTSDEVRTPPDRFSFFNVPNPFRYLNLGARDAIVQPQETASQERRYEAGYGGATADMGGAAGTGSGGRIGAGAAGVEEARHDRYMAEQQGARKDESDANALTHQQRRSAADNDQLWPQLQALVEPYGLRRSGDLTEDQVSPVRQKADDLREPDA